MLGDVEQAYILTLLTSLLAGEQRYRVSTQALEKLLVIEVEDNKFVDGDEFRNRVQVLESRSRNQAAF
jgi:hypothetical protein